MCRLSSPYRATTDLDVVDRLHGEVPQLQVLRAAQGAKPVEPAAVLLPTPYGQVKVDVLEVRQIEIDHPSDDPGDRLHCDGFTTQAARTSPSTTSISWPNSCLRPANEVSSTESSHRFGRLAVTGTVP
jgi:hypothetical protein